MRVATALGTSATSAVGHHRNVGRVAGAGVTTHSERRPPPPADATMSTTAGTTVMPVQSTSGAIVTILTVPFTVIELLEEFGLEARPTHTGASARVGQRPADASALTTRVAPWQSRNQAAVSLGAQHPGTASLRASDARGTASHGVPVRRMTNRSWYPVAPGNLVRFDP